MREPLSGDDDAVQLAIAADHLRMDSMKSVCIKLISSTVTEENIWSFLEQLLVVKLFDMAIGCYQVSKIKYDTKTSRKY